MANGNSGLALGTGTGSQGSVAPPEGGSGGGELSSLLQWINTPFTTPLSPLTIFLIVGVVVLGIFGWNIILYHMRLAAETI